MKKKIYVSISIVLLIIFIVTFSNFLKDVSENEAKIISQSPQYYKDLFEVSAQKEVVFKWGAEYKPQNVKAIYSYKDNNMLISRAPVSPKFDVEKNIIANNSMDENGSDLTTTTGGKDFEIVYGVKTLDLLEKLYISTSVPIEARYKNNGLLYYYANIKETLIKYNQEEQYEFSVRSRDNENKLIIICYLKKDNFLYQILLWNEKENAKLQPDDLYKIIIK